MTNYSLTNPTSYLDEGDSSEVFPLNIAPHVAGILQFENSGNSGAEGIFTYDIVGADKVLIVVYDVPDLRALYDNKFYAFIADDPKGDVSANEDLFDTYSDKTVNTHEPRLFCIPSKDKQFRVQVQMSTSEKAKMLVSVWQNGNCPLKTTSGSSYLGNFAFYSHLTWLIWFACAVIC